MSACEGSHSDPTCGLTIRDGFQLTTQRHQKENTYGEVDSGSILFHRNVLYVYFQAVFFFSCFHECLMGCSHNTVPSGERSGGSKSILTKPRGCVQNICKGNWCSKTGLKQPLGRGGKQGDEFPNLASVPLPLCRIAQF